MFSAYSARSILVAFVSCVLLFFTGLAPSIASPAPDRGAEKTATRVTIDKPSLHNVKQISAGKDFTLALDTQGRAFAWGDNNGRQLGNDTTTDSIMPVRVQKPAGVSFTRISAGDRHALALGDDGNTYAWGYNWNGRLGTGDLWSSGIPQLVNQPEGVVFTEISAGGFHNLAIGDDGKTYAWGANDTGQLGSKTEQEWSEIPVLVNEPDEVAFTQVSAGWYHSLAIGDDGNTYAWGQNSHGELGDDSAINALEPVIVQLPDGVRFIKVEAGQNYSLAIGDDGRTYAWGANYVGQLGTDAVEYASAVPVVVQQPEGVAFTDITAGLQHSYARGDDGYIYSWGDNDYGQLGNGMARSNNFTPERVHHSEGVTYEQITAGNNHGVSVGRDGSIYTWGSSSGGALGRATDDFPASSIPVIVRQPDDVTFTLVSAGESHSLALGDDDNVYAWGANQYGEVGDGTVSTANVPVRVQLPEEIEITSLATGFGHSLALSADGRIFAWGHNFSGELGNGTTVSSSVPVLVEQPEGVDFIQIAAGSSHSIALGDDGKTYAWGNNARNQLGNNATKYASWTPVQVTQPAGVTFTRITAGYEHNLATGNDGNTYAWGSDWYGELGNGPAPGSSSPVRVDMPDGVKVTDISAGYFNSVALGEDTNTYAWGSNSFGELGNGKTWNFSSPALVQQPDGVVFTKVSSGRNYVIAIGDDGMTYAWGSNYDGQLGDGVGAKERRPHETEWNVEVTDVLFGGVSGTSLHDNGDGTVSVLTPALPAGIVDVQLSWTMNGLAQDPIVYPDGFTFEGPSHEEVTPAEPGFADNVITVPAVEGVEYLIDDLIVTGRIEITEDTTVTARAIEGYVLAEEAVATWDYIYIEPVVEPKGNVFYILNDWESTTHDLAFSYGRVGDEVFVGDWDGNGTDTLAVRRGITFYVNNELRGGNADAEFKYGRMGDEVLVGDWDGDGEDTFAVRRGINFYVNNSLRGGIADAEFKYGRFGDEVLVGDWDGDSEDTFAVRRGINFYANNELRGGNADAEFKYGREGDEVLVGDFDGDGYDTFTVRRGNVYYVNNALIGGNSQSELTFGLSTDKAFVGDWNGDNIDTLAINRTVR